LEKLET
jgi:Skp family chaperone for outer membrane proteins